MNQKEIAVSAHHVGFEKTFEVISKAVATQENPAKIIPAATKLIRISVSGRASNCKTQVTIVGTGVLNSS